MNYRDITQLEPLVELPDDAYIIVVVNGVAKRISRSNAKFGGAVTILYASVNSSHRKIADGAPSISLYVDSNLTESATPQMIFDAYSAGTLRIIVRADSARGASNVSTSYQVLNVLGVTTTSEDLTALDNVALIIPTGSGIRSFEITNEEEK